MEPLTNNGSISNAIETGYKKAPCVYRTSAIFGANASGKSNFIEAMLALKFLITKSYRNSTDSNIYGLEYKLADTQNNALFEIEFIKNRNVYRYFIELNKKAIVREEAYYNELQADIQQCRKAGFVDAVSVPCYEYWLLLHLKKTNQPFRDAKECCETFQSEYNKKFQTQYTVKQLKAKTDIFNDLNDNLDSAIANADNLELEEASCPYTNMHSIIKKLLKHKIKN